MEHREPLAAVFNDLQVILARVSFSICICFFLLCQNFSERWQNIATMPKNYDVCDALITNRHECNLNILYLC